jgi:hypothetical protein
MKLNKALEIIQNNFLENHPRLNKLLIDIKDLEELDRI